MHRFAKSTGLALAALIVGAALAPAAHAQYVQVYSPPPVVVGPPVVTYYQPPVTTYYAPPVTTYYAPPVSYSYYPTTVYSPPVVSPGVVTTRSFVGYGIFRPRGVYTQTYVSPPGVTPSYYTPWVWR